MNLIIIAGGGKFGLKALEFVNRNNFKTIIIDNNPNCYIAKFVTHKFDNIEDFNLKLNNLKDGDIFFLNQNIEIVYELIEKLDPKYVIPVIPIHLMASVLISFLLKFSIKLIPATNLTNKFSKNANPELLLNQNIENGVVYLSYAKLDEICPDNCSGPEEYCPNFKREKPITITRYLKDFYEVKNTVIIEKNKIPKFIIINESYQLMPGLGGLKGKDISKNIKILQKNLDILLNQRFNIIIATTCNCHGVINFYQNY